MTRQRILAIFFVFVAWATLAHAARDFNELNPIAALPSAYDPADPVEAYWLASLEPMQSVYMRASLVAASGVSITINAGGTSGGLTGNQLENQATFTGDGMVVPYVLPVANPTLIPTCYVFWGTDQPGNWSCAIYKGGTTPGLPDGATNVCNSSTQTNGVTLGAFNSIALNSCPGALTGNVGDVYWFATTYTSTTTQLGSTGFQGACPYGELLSVHEIQGNQTASTITPWPSTFPSSLSTALSGTGCYSVYVQLSYTSANAWDFISINAMACDQGVDECAGKIAPPQAGHGFGVMVHNSGDGNTVTSVKTQTAGVNTDTLTQVGCATGSNIKWCFYWADRVTVGVDGVDCILTGSGGSYKTACISFELRGTIASGAVDQSHFDSALISSLTFSSGSTATTTQAHELLIGGDFDSWPSGTQILAYITPNSPWSPTPLSTFGAGNAPSQDAFFTQEVFSTGAYNIAGTSNAGAASNGHLPGLMTLKLP